MDIIWRVGEGINGEERKGCRNRNGKKTAGADRACKKKRGRPKASESKEVLEISKNLDEKKQSEKEEETEKKIM